MEELLASRIARLLDQHCRNGRVRHLSVRWFAWNVRADIRSVQGSSLYSTCL